MSKELCDCGKVAVWDYSPGYSGGGNSYSCDDCVPRGCECNHNYVDVNAYHPALNHPNLPEGKEGKDSQGFRKCNKQRLSKTRCNF